jgi:hypothetical protein
MGKSKMTTEKNDVLRSKISSTKLQLRAEIVNFSTPDKNVMMIRQELKNYCQQLNILEQKQSIISNDIYRQLILIISIILISFLFFISYKFGQIALHDDDYRSAAFVNRCGNLPGEELNPIEFIQKSAQRQKCLQSPATELTHIKALARKIIEILSN